MPPLLSDLLLVLLGAALALGGWRLIRSRPTPGTPGTPVASIASVAPAAPPEHGGDETSPDVQPEQPAPPPEPDPAPPPALDAMFQGLPQALLIVNAIGRIQHANPAALALFGESAEALQLRPFALPETDAPMLLALSRQGLPPLEVEAYRSPLTWRGQPAWLVSLQDLTERNALRQALDDATTRLHVIADHACSWECWMLPGGAYAYVSPACERITGYEARQLLGDPLFVQGIVEEEDLQGWKDFMHASATSTTKGDTLHLDYRLRRKNGRQVWISQINCPVHGQDGSLLGLRTSAQDITARKQMELELRRQTLHDQLTGLPNRALFLDRLEHARLRASRRSDYFFALCFLDLDRFKTINDSLGHTAGDKVLVEVTRRILDSIRTLDTVSRFGGDEYAILLEELVSPRGAVQIVKRIRQLISEPLLVNDSELRITASMGVVLSPMDNLPAELLLRNANIALHAAKEQGRDCFKVFTNKMLDQAVMLMTMEQEMRRGVQGDEFFLAFQPFVHLHTSELVGFEALVRWRHPTRGLMPPGAFIALAEETGAIIDLGSMVLHKACLAWVAWAEQWPAVRNTLMSVNISGRQFSQFGFLDSIRSVLEKTGMPPERLKLEITETAIMEDAESSAEKLNRIKEMGIALSIDDFGTGYSSMSYLQRFPLDNLKIDLSFIRLMHVSQENMEIVRAIINLAHTLGMEVVAEGVEDASQRRTLQELNCEYAQGYFYARPMPDDEMRAFLAGLDQEHPVVPPLAQAAG